MPKIIAAIVFATLLGGCASYTERTSPCVCNWERMSPLEEATV